MIVVTAFKTRGKVAVDNNGVVYGIAMAHLMNMDDFGGVDDGGGGID